MFDEIHYALARFSALLHAALFEQLGEVFEIFYLLEVLDLPFELVVIFRQRERQFSEIPEELAALAFVFVIVVTIEEDGDIHDGGVEGGAAVVGQEGVAGGEKFVHVVDLADVDEMLVACMSCNMPCCELRMEAKEDDPAAAESDV